ncbi:hypothetical protein PTMSG1_01859 [Pyrenophora teres f. maculata]|nr:hypothetical protein PTMSG1_01859 [Pyrenophora teres f. maculata]
MDRIRTVQSGHDDIVPLITSSEPTSYNSGDVVIQEVDDTPVFSPPMVASPEIMDAKGGAYRNFSTPSSGSYRKFSTASTTFDMEDGSQHGKESHHIKRFDHREARKSLLITGASKLLITIFFSAAMCITLKSWEGFRHPIVLSKKDLRVFNSLTIGLSLCLGLNLLASLKHYASVFRWTFLSRRYVSLEVFDLILHLSSLAKVTKLMIISSPGFRGKTWLRRFRWFKDVRDDGTKWMWLACLAWLLINISSQVLVALLSLFWPTNNSELPLLSKGNVTVADLNAWYVDKTSPELAVDPEKMMNGAPLDAAWTYGMAGMAYPVFNISDIQKDLSGQTGVPIYKGDGTYTYRFFNREPTHQWLNYMASSRNITAKATCTQLELKDSEVQNRDSGRAYLVAREPGTEEYLEWEFPEIASGSMTYAASLDPHCGDRCTNFTITQIGIKDDPVSKTSVFICNSTLSNVTDPIGNKDITMRTRSDFAAVYGTNGFARTAAGAIGWAGLWTDTWPDRQYRSYIQGNKWSPARNMQANEVEDLLMHFTINAVAAFDDHGIRYNLMSQTVVPTQGQQLDIDWPYIFSILGGICGIQFVALVLLVLFAHRTIIRDDSYFSMAMLLRPVVSRIGEGGMLLSGDEIKESKALKWKKIRYDYREGADGEPNRVAIFWEGRDQKEGRKSWAAGSYS